MNDTTPVPPTPPMPEAEGHAAAAGPAPDAAFSLPPDTTAYYCDQPAERNRLTSFFRYFTALPHLIWLMLYGIAAFFAVIAAWFAMVFTTQYPEGLYKFVADFHRYYTRVYAYMYLITDVFPPFNGNSNEAYAAHFLVGPPKEAYSRGKAFFRWLLIIPFAIVSSVLTTVYQVVAIIVWFVILFTGRQSDGLQDLMNFCYGFTVRMGSYALLLTEDWPKFSDQAVTASLQERGYVGTIPPSA